jgi:hypothetical protein
MYQWECPACGSYRISRSADKELGFDSTWGSDARKRRALASAFLRERRDDAPVLSDGVEKLKTLQVPTTEMRLLKLLAAAKLKSHMVGEQITISGANPEWLSISWSHDAREVASLVRALVGEGRLKGPTIGDGEEFSSYVSVTAAGEKYLSSAGMANLGSATALIAMWFDRSMDPAHSAMRRAIESAGFRPERLDDIEHVEKIDDLILRRIEAARFVVADFTGQRGGVYFEAGYARGLRIPVVWMCREDEVHKLHFDIRQYNSIVWSDPAGLAEKLHKRLHGLPELRS